jgi:hypothetical protein
VLPRTVELLFVVLVGITAALSVVLWQSARWDPITKTSLRVLVAFLALSYLARPLAVLWDKPSWPSPHPLADYRLVWIGYGEGLVRVLTPVAVGLAAGVVTLSLGRRWAERHVGVVSRQRAPWRPEWSAALVCTFMVGWAGRLLSERLPLLDSLAAFATPSLCLLIVFAGWRRSAVGTLMIVPACLGELAWAVHTASKSPITAILFAGLLWAVIDTDRRTRHRAYAVAGALGLAIFFIVQPLKGAYESHAETYSTHFRGPAGDLALTLLRRSDMISAVTDAESTAKPASFQPKHYAQRLVAGLLPDGALVGSAVPTSGVVWTRDLRAASNPHQYLDLSLAEGPVAEGLVVGGRAGAIVASVVMMIALLMASRGVASSSIFVRCICGLLLFSTTLFERGPLALAEGIGEGVQFAVVASGIVLLLRAGWSNRSAEPLELQELRLRSSVDGGRG